MMKPIPIALDDIYVPVKFRDTLDPEKVETIAESALESGLQSPIQVRPGKGNYVLVKGFHRLEAMRMLGEETIEALIVQARQF